MTDARARLSVQQEYFPDGMCFGCGPANDRGLRINSYVDDDGLVRATFMPWPEHNNGMGYLNGGIIATLLDCHSAAAMLHEFEIRDWPPYPDVPLPYVTAGLDVKYLRPAPLAEEVLLVAEVIDASEAEMSIKVALEWDGKPRSEVVALWKRWRPR